MGDGRGETKGVFYFSLAGKRVLTTGLLFPDPPSSLLPYITTVLYGQYSMFQLRTIAREAFFSRKRLYLEWGGVAIIRAAFFYGSLGIGLASSACSVCGPEGKEGALKMVSFSAAAAAAAEGEWGGGTRPK